MDGVEDGISAETMDRIENREVWIRSIVAPPAVLFDREPHKLFRFSAVSSLFALDAQYFTTKRKTPTIAVVEAADATGLCGLIGV